uniref:Methyltransferase type 11 domain-containing protein n=1 Tax=Alexandrium monilatum TaxID=311494 RepID=A0A7S4SJ91_9DINO
MESPTAAATPSPAAELDESGLCASGGPLTGCGVAFEAVKEVLSALTSEWAGSGSEQAETCAALVGKALGRPVLCRAWEDPEGLRCAAPRGLAEALGAEAEAAEAAGAGGLARSLRALRGGVDVFSWKEPRHLVSDEMRPEGAPALSIDALLGGPGRFKSAMMVGLRRYGASFESDEILVGLTWLAPGTFYPQHAHDAAELYQMMVGTGAWGPTQGHLEPMPPGRFLSIPSASPHTVQAPADGPLLAVYAWTGRLNGRFWFCDCALGDKYSSDINKIASPEDYYNAMAGDYESVVRSWGYRMPEAAVDALKAQADLSGAPSTLNVLDLGCGDGLVGAALQAHGFECVVGADISSEMLAKAKLRRCYREVHRSDLSQKLPFEDDVFDVILCVGTTTYLEPAVLVDWLRVVRPGGALILTHKTSVWKVWEPDQELLVRAGAMTQAWVSEPMHYLPSLRNDAKADPDERAKVYVYRKATL